MRRLTPQFKSGANLQQQEQHRPSSRAGGAARGLSEPGEPLNLGQIAACSGRLGDPLCLAVEMSKSQTWHTCETHLGVVYYDFPTWSSLNV